MGKLNITDAYSQMYTIRRFEETLLKLFSENKLQGTTHTSIGQEADAVGVMRHVTDRDFVFSSHRCHGQFLAYAGDARILMSEIMGKESGMCKGRGGSQHICYRHFYTNGVQGGIVPDAAGVAFAEKIRAGQKDEEAPVVVVFLGDGTLGQGVVYETFNMAALYHLPVLFVIEENGYAMSTKTADAVAGSIRLRAEAFGIHTCEVQSNDVCIIDAEAGKAFHYVRKQQLPYCLILHTYRLGPHSKGDDNRDKKEIEVWQKQDPLRIAESRLDEETAKKIREKADQMIAEAEGYAKGQKTDAFIAASTVKGRRFRPGQKSLLNHKKIKCVESLNLGLEKALKDMPDVVLLGEDICDPYGGAFKVTKGLSAQYPDRVINTPISEAGVAGICAGMAMNGMKPVMEMMFGDFITLSFDQLLNHAAKYNGMYAGQVKVPMLIRAPMGGGRGYGATHSQSLEKFLIGIPDLKVFALSKLMDAGQFVCRILDGLDGPAVLIEHKRMYAGHLYLEKDGRIGLFSVEDSRTEAPVYKLSILPQQQADLAVITYGAMTDLAMNAAEQLMMEDELNISIIVHTSLSPLDVDAMSGFLGDTRNILTLEEGTGMAGWGAEVIAQLAGRLSGRSYGRLAACDCVIPCGIELEQKVLPDERKLMEQIRRMCNV